MNRITYGMIKDECGLVTNLCSGDPRLLVIVNRVCERLLYEMKSVGTFPRYRVCVNNACITWPRMIETIEAFALCNRPGTVRNGWYEFLENGPGELGQTTCNGRQLVDAGESVAFDNVIGTDKKLAVSVDVEEESGSKIIIQYYDSSGQWVRTKPSGAWIDGEEVPLPATGFFSYTSLNVMPPGAIRIIKPVTNGVVRLWEYDTITTDLKALAIYEPSETIPVYRRSTIPNLPKIPCCTKTDSCDKISLTVVASIRFIPIAKDNDFLCISHPDAVRLGCQALHKERSDMLDDAAKYWMMANRCLTKQLEHWIGHGAVQPMRMVGANTFGGHVRALR